MRVKKKGHKLKVAGLAVLAVIMLLVCHGAFSPHQLLPQGFRWGLYPVEAGREDYPLTAGDMVVVDKNAPPELGAMAALGDGASNRFGRVVAQGDGLYTLRLWADGQPMEVSVSHPHRVVYRIAGLGSFFLFLHAYRGVVWLSCLSLLLAWTIYRLATAKNRRMKHTRENYIRLFDEYAQQLDPDEEY